MENSEIVLFGDDAPHWYLAMGEKWVGPLSASDIHERIQAQKITWAHFVWRKGQAEWKRICETEAFEAVAPKQPNKAFQKEIKESSKPVIKQAAPRASAERRPALESSRWFLHHDHSQFGPFSIEEVKRFIQVGKINGRVHGWREGMKTWDRLERITEFAIDFAKQVPPKRDPKKDLKKDPQSDQRTAPRRPLIAKILLTDERNVIVGVCRDISVGGLQILTDRLPGKVGTTLKMNLSPSNNDSGKSIESFVAEGVVVRILEDGRGFSFRFKQLSEKAKQAIEAYIES